MIPIWIFLLIVIVIAIGIGVKYYDNTIAPTFVFKDKCEKCGAEVTLREYLSPHTLVSIVEGKCEYCGNVTRQVMNF